MMRKKIPGLFAGGLALMVQVMPPAAAEALSETTLLHLSATASVQVSPDQLVADLVATATSTSPASAQQHVNALMSQGMKTAHDVAGIEARAIGYSVLPAADSSFSPATGSKHQLSGWTAQQTLELRGADGPALLDLAGRLQDRGFVTAGLDWRLSQPLWQRAHDEANTAALKQLRDRAAATAEAMGLHVAYPKEIQLDGPIYRTRALPMMAMARASPPQASAAPEDVTTTVSADYVLKP